MFGRKMILLVVAASIALLLSMSVSAAAPDKQITIGVSLMTLNSPFFVAIERGLNEAAAATGAEIIITDAQLNLAKQISSVENLIARHVDVILLNAVDSTAVGPAVEAANKAGIPVIALDVMASQGKIESLVASDNVEAGRMGAEFIAKKLNGKGTVAILDGPPITSFMDRVKGFKEVIGKYPDIKIVREKRVVENSIAKFVEGADNILTAVPDLDAVFAVNDFGALAVKSVVESSSRKFHVFAVGVDGMPDTVEAIKDGKVIAATVAQQPAEMGKLAVKAAVDLAEGKKIASNVKVPLMLVDKDNAGLFSW